MLETNEEIDFFILIVDKKDLNFNKDKKIKNLIWSEDLSIKKYNALAFKYDILEFNTALKPFLMMHLLNTYEYCIYLDPDIEMFDSLIGITNKLENYNCIILPHTIKPIDDNRNPTEIEFMKAGAYNLGFIAFKRSDESLKLLRWWWERCTQNCFNDKNNGIFVDQKFIDLAPSFFDNIFIEKSRQLNVAYWNLHERVVSEKDNKYYVNNLPLIFFHFSGFDMDNKNIGYSYLSKYQNRTNISDEPALKMMLEKYKNKLISNNYYFYKSMNYTYDYFDNGVFINNLTRKIYSDWSIDKSEMFDPFDSSGQYYKIMKDKSIIKEGVRENKTEIDKNNLKYKMAFLNKIFKMLHFLLGTNRYLLLLKYLSYASSLRNQSKIIM